MDSTVVLKTGIRSLECLLTDAEKLVYGERVGALSIEWAKVDAEREEAAASYKARLKGLQNEQNGLLSRLATGRESREIPVETVADFATGKAITYRKDTGEEIGRRPLTHDELQLKIEFETSGMTEEEKQRRRFVDLVGEEPAREDPPAPGGGPENA